MVLIPLLLSFVVAVGMYASFAKLAARMYRRSQLSWKAALGFGALVAPLAFLGTALRGTLPTAAAIAVCMPFLVAVGAWFLASRANDPAGHPVGFKVAAALSAIAVVMAFALGMLLTVVLQTIAPL